LSGKPIKVLKSKEPWSEYTLDDGVVLRFRVTVHNVRRVEDKFTPVGDPEYSFTHQFQCETIAPDAMRRAVEPAAD
jgi:hypothetical protein